MPLHLAVSKIVPSVAPVRLRGRAPCGLGGAGFTRAVKEVDWVPSYRALTGLDYPPDRRIEAGEIASDLPPKSIKWLLEQGLIEPTDGSKSKPAPTPVEEPVTEGGDE